MKTILFIASLIFSSSLYAQSCWLMLEAEAAKINKEDGYTQNVGGQFFVLNGQIGYWPGFQVPADIDNWAEDFVYAVKFGPMMMTYREDPRDNILHMFRKEIKDECDLPKDKHDKLRAMLKELMDDGSFCPGGVPLDRPFLSRWKHYKKVLSKAVSEGRFQEHCISKAVVDDASREVKDVGASPASGTQSNGAVIGQ
jgi:hypothetical protein